jgi:hypothetical protein
MPKKMTDKQVAFYWREWAAVRRVKPDADRHELHVSALGYDKSMRELTNNEFDLVLAEFKSISDNSDLGVQVRELNQHRKRCLYSIRQHPKDYVEEVARDKFGTINWTVLPTKKLETLAMTLTERERANPKKEENPGAALAAEEPICTRPNTIECPF